MEYDEARRGWDLIAWTKAGQQARAEELAERLERATDALFECRIQGLSDDLNAKRSVLFDLYEREILTRDQVRNRGDLDPAAFYEELHTYRMRHAGRQSEV